MRDRFFVATAWLPRLVARVHATVHAKLLVGFLVIVALLIVLGAVGLQALGRVNRRAEGLVRHQQRIAAFHQFQRDMLLPPSWSWNQATLETTLRQLTEFRYDLDQLQFVAMDDAEPLAKLSNDYAEFIDVVGQLIGLVRDGNPTGARNLHLAKAGPLAARLERLTNDLVNKAEADMAASLDASEEAYVRSRRVVIAFSVASIGLALVLGYAISWALIGPVKQMEMRLQLVASGDFSQRVEVPNRDELGVLAHQFNHMVVQLEESYAKLEERSHELQTRTSELARLVEELKALGEVGQAVSSTLDLGTVLNTIVTRAVQLSSASSGIIYEYDEAREELNHISGAHHLDPELGEVLRTEPIRLGEGAAGKAAALHAPVQLPDILVEGAYDVGRVRAVFERRGYRSLLAVPLLFEERIMGVLVVWRREPGSFAPEIVNLLQTFATQSVLAIQNARLFREIADKSEQLEAASRHKSEFLASMSHELRTPLNAVLGFNEMILGEVYGDVPLDLKEPLTDIQNSGKHLLRLINNVLDLSKIEAGRMELALADYVVQDTVETVRASLYPLATDKGLEFVASVSEEIPLAYGDAGRITQCLMNLAGNALKFTRQGRVGISADLQDGLLIYRVTDTGIGIAKDRIETVFAEFQQGDARITSEFGGTGLGLSISKKFVEMHRGRIWVESELGKGSTFFLAIPLRVAGGETV